MYVFGKKPIDLDDCIEKLANMVSESQDRVFVVRHDVAYTHASGKILYNVPVPQVDPFQ